MTETADTVVLEELEVRYTASDLVSMPPFSRWGTSRRSGGKLEATIRRLLPEVADALEPRGVYRLEPKDGSGLDAHDPPAELRDVSHVVTGVVTIGDGPDVRSGDDGLFDEFARDAIENVFVHNAREQVIRAVEERADDAGLNTTRVIPPGTGAVNWPIEHRRFVFDRLPTERIGAELDESGNTHPRKTYAFVVGADADIDQAEWLLTCEGCPLLGDCEYAGCTIEATTA